MQAELISFFRRTFLRHNPRRFAVMQPETADRKYNDYPGELSDRQLAAHLAGRAAYAVPTAENGLAHLLPFDIDAGSEEAARALLNAAAKQGLWAFAQVDTTRGRGYVWLPFNDLTNTARVHSLGQQLLAQINCPKWKIENRATAEDTRLPFARHSWTNRRGMLLYQDGTSVNLDGNEATYAATLANFMVRYRENPTNLLPPPPEPLVHYNKGTLEPQSQGVTIHTYNATTDLVQLLEDYGAKPARGRGTRLYFCPFHNDRRASLLISKDGQRCKCLSTASNCSLSGHQYDAFNVYCIQHGYNPNDKEAIRAALRQINNKETQHTRSTGYRNSQYNCTRVFNTKQPYKNTEFYKTSELKKPYYHKMATENCDHIEQPLGSSVIIPETHKTSKSNTAIPHQLQNANSNNEKELETTPRNGQRIPTEHPKLPKSARRVLDYLRQQAVDYCRGKYHLAQVLDIDPRTVQRSLRRLEAEGLIIRYQRGHDGQTDIYHPTSTRRTTTYGEQDFNTPLNSALTATGGRHLPPTVVLESIPIVESLEAKRGGGFDHTAAPDEVAAYQDRADVFPDSRLNDTETHVSVLVEQAKDGVLLGPAGAIVYPGGAAYVPPEAEDWYAMLPPDVRGEVCTLAYQIDPEPVQLPSTPATSEYVPVEPPKPKRRRKQETYIDPGKLRGRIIAAERKAAKLEAEKTAKARAQARAIRREVDRLKLRFKMQQERQYSAEEAEQWQPPAPPARDDKHIGQDEHEGTSTTAELPPLTSSAEPGPNWPYLKRLYQIGEMAGIERHCILTRVLFADVLHVLQCL